MGGTVSPLVGSTLTGTEVLVIEISVGTEPLIAGVDSSVDLLGFAVGSSGGVGGEP